MGEHQAGSLGVKGSNPLSSTLYFLKRDSKRAKSEIAMSKSNFSGWPTRAGAGAKNNEHRIAQRARG